jgi:hypothetical protein
MSITPEIWLSLHTSKRLVVLAEDVASGYKWNWDNYELLIESLFEELGIEPVVQKFIDVSKIDMASSGLLGNYLPSSSKGERSFFTKSKVRELSDVSECCVYDDDLGLEPARFLNLRERLIDYFCNIIAEEDESAERELVDLLDLPVITRESYTINSVDLNNEPTTIRLTRLFYSNLDQVDLITPWDDDELHEILPEPAEWIELGKEVEAETNYDEALYKFFGVSDVNEADEKAKSELAQFESEVSSVFGSDFEIPTSDDIEGFNPFRLGDQIDQDEDDQDEEIP